MRQRDGAVGRIHDERSVLDHGLRVLGRRVAQVIAFDLDAVALAPKEVTALIEVRGNLTRLSHVHHRTTARAPLSRAVTIVEQARSTSITTTVRSLTSSSPRFQPDRNTSIFIRSRPVAALPPLPDTFIAHLLIAGQSKAR